jgi:hypothetical protein
MDVDKSLVPRADEYHTLCEMAEMLRGTPFVPQHFDSTGKILAAMLKARELGIPPMYGLTHLFPAPGGKIGTSAEVMLALIYRTHGPDAIGWIEHTAESACVEYRRKGASASGRYCFTMEDARRAGLTGKDVWNRYPAAMLRARVISAVARMVFPDVIAGMYSYEEIDLPVYVTPEGEVALDNPAVARLAEWEAAEKEMHEAGATRKGAQQTKAQPAAQAPAQGEVVSTRATVGGARKGKQQVEVTDHNGKDHVKTTQGVPQKPPAGPPLADRITQKSLADEIRQETGSTLRSTLSWQMLARTYNVMVPANHDDMTIGWLANLLSRIRERKTEVVRYQPPQQAENDQAE